MGLSAIVPLLFINIYTVFFAAKKMRPKCSTATRQAMILDSRLAVSLCQTNYFFENSPLIKHTLDSLTYYKLKQLLSSNAVKYANFYQDVCSLAENQRDVLSITLTYSVNFDEVDCEFHVTVINGEKGRFWLISVLMLTMTTTLAIRFLTVHPTRTSADTRGQLSKDAYISICLKSSAVCVVKRPSFTDKWRIVFKLYFACKRCDDSSC
jgi:hypothetical protein